MIIFLKHFDVYFFLSSLVSLLFCVLVVCKNRNSRLNQAFSIFSFLFFIWLFSFALANYYQELSIKLLWFRIGYIGIIFMPVSFYAFVSYLTNRSPRNLSIVINFLIAIVFLFLHIFRVSLVKDLYEYSWGYYPGTKLMFHCVFLIFLMGLFNISIIRMAVYLFKNKLRDTQYMRVKYVMFGTILGTLSTLDFIGSYGVPFPPVGYLFMLLYPTVFSYAILKYRLMDITIAITRFGIFVGVYSIVLGIPFILAFGWKSILYDLAFDQWWLIPLISSTILAAIGPNIYLYFQKRAEDGLLQEQRQYQATLRQASLGMGRIKNLGKLLELIVHIVTRAVKIEHCDIYLKDAESRDFLLKASRNNNADSRGLGRKNIIETDGRGLGADSRLNADGRGLGTDSRGLNQRPSDLDQRPSASINKNSVLISFFQDSKEPVIYEEVKQKMQDYGDAKLTALESVLRELNAAIAVPSFIEERLIAVIVLGKKRSGKLYSQDDLAVFSILANQSALAIENALFYEDMKKSQEQLFKAEKMATIGTMADGLSHQINNRFHAMGFIAGDALDSIKTASKDNLAADAQIKTLFDAIEHGLTRIQYNVAQGGKTVEGVLKYTRKSVEGFAAVELNQIVDAAIEMMQFKPQGPKMKFIKNFDAHKLPAVLGNFTQLQEVLFNVMDNSYDAIEQKREELKDPEFQGEIAIFAQSEDDELMIIINDNGAGVKEEDLAKLFTPFFTTKLSSRKGTGLGLYVIRQIIEEAHNGRVEFSSNFGVGSTVTVYLPVAKESVLGV